MIRNNLKAYAWIGDEYVKGRIRQVVLSFHGLGYSGMKDFPDMIDLELASGGALCVFPFYGPWSWMNKQAVTLVDQLVDGIFENYGLSRDIPVIATGSSMGGLSALMYTRYAKRTPVACYVNCPVCDLPYHMTEREDLPRTMYSAFAHYECGIEEAIRRTSPVHEVNNMPDIPYLIVHGESDKSVNKQKHSDIFVEKMKETGHNIEYIPVKNMGHCSINEYTVLRCTMDFIKSFATL